MSRLTLENGVATVTAMRDLTEAEKIQLSQAVCDALKQEGVRNIILDLGGILNIPSSGPTIHWLEGLTQMVLEKGKGFKILLPLSRQGQRACQEIGVDN